MSLSRLFLFTTIIGVVFSYPRSGARGFQYRIVNGYDAREGKFPYQISLVQYEEHFCGGSILTDRWVLTAAHCVSELDPREVLQVVVGSNQLLKGQRYEVIKTIPQNAFDPNTARNDIALLKTKDRIIFSDLVKPIPIRSSFVEGGVLATSSGWGFKNYPGKATEKLQAVSIKTLSNEECYKDTEEKNRVFIQDSVLCTSSEKGQGVCKGDSGGPLVVEGELVGVVSWGSPCARGYPDVFTRLSEFTEWMNKTMGGN